MKAALLILGQANGDTTGTEKDTVAATNLQRLRDLFAQQKQPQVRLNSAGQLEFVAEFAERVPEGRTVFIAGSPSGAQLKETCHALRMQGYHAIVVFDALADVGQLDAVIQILTSDKCNFQFSITGAVKGLLTATDSFVYAYPKADSTATIVIFFDDGENVLTITRGLAPFKGEESFPGGFLHIGFETLRQCAQRETEEETGLEIDLEMIRPVDERSEPDRDPRGHVVDHGYCVIVPKELKAKVLEKLAPDGKDDAESAKVTPVKELLARPRMAFDHRDLLIAALKVAGYSTSA